VNSILPAAETRMTDALREFWHVERDAWMRNFPGDHMPTTDEIADVFWFLGSDASRYVTGQILAVDAGFGLL
jgi:NAD(P)-dependent dehydrogenase (short-subunit alcohol dehydrogenase family)